MIRVVGGIDRFAINLRGFVIDCLVLLAGMGIYRVLGARRLEVDFWGTL